MTCQKAEKLMICCQLATRPPNTAGKKLYRILKSSVIREEPESGLPGWRVGPQLHMLRLKRTREKIDLRLPRHPPFIPLATRSEPLGFEVGASPLWSRQPSNRRPRLWVAMGGRWLTSFHFFLSRPPVLLSKKKKKRTSDDGLEAGGVEGRRSRGSLAWVASGQR